MGAAVGDLGYEDARSIADKRTSAQPNQLSMHDYISIPENLLFPYSSTLKPKTLRKISLTPDGRREALERHLFEERCLSFLQMPQPSWRISASPASPSPHRPWVNPARDDTKTHRRGGIKTGEPVSPRPPPADLRG